MDRLNKRELIEEINDTLDTLSPARAQEMLSKLTIIELVWLKQAIDAKLKETR